MTDNKLELPKSYPESPMTLNKKQFQKLIDNYANHIIEGLDIESMEIMLFDLLTSEYETYTEDQIVGEIEKLYGEEVAQSFYNDVTVAELAQTP